MEHKRVSVALTAAGVLAVLGGLLVFFVFAPIAGINSRASYPELAFLFWPALAALWVIASVYLAAMVFYFRIVSRIGKDQSFCAANAQDMRRIACCMAAAGFLWLLAAFLPEILWKISLGPVVLGFVLASVASFAVAILAWGLGRLLWRAVFFKEENDLTI